MAKQDSRTRLYEAVTAEGFNIGTFEEFDSKMEIPESRQKFYEAVTAEGLNIGTFEEFDSKISPVKKKDDTQVPSPLQQFANGGESLFIKSKIPSEKQNEFNNWRESLPENLKSETEYYDLEGAFLAGLEPEEMQDGHHLGSRDPNTGLLLKSPDHPTYDKMIKAEKRLGNKIVYKNGRAYSISSEEEKSLKERRKDLPLTLRLPAEEEFEKVPEKEKQRLAKQAELDQSDIQSKMRKDEAEDIRVSTSLGAKLNIYEDNQDNSDNVKNEFEQVRSAITNIQRQGGGAQVPVDLVQRFGELSAAVQDLDKMENIVKKQDFYVKSFLDPEEKSTLDIYNNYLKENEPKAFKAYESQKDQGELDQFSAALHNEKALKFASEALKSKYSQIENRLGSDFMREIDGLEDFNEEVVNYLSDLDNQYLNETNSEKQAELKEAFKNTITDTGIEDSKQRYDEMISNPDFQELIQVGDQMNKVNDEARSYVKQYPEYQDYLKWTKEEQAKRDEEYKNSGWVKQTSSDIGTATMATLGKAVNDILTLPRSLSQDDEFGWADKLAQSSENFFKYYDTAYSLTPTKHQRGLIENVVDVDGFDVVLDDKDEITAVRDKDGYQAGEETASLISEQYKKDPEKYYKTREVQWATVFPKTLQLTGDMGMMFLGAGKVTGALKALGATQKASQTIGLTTAVIAQTHNQAYNEATRSGLSPSESSKYAMSVAGATALIAQVNPQYYVFSKEAPKRLLANYARKYFTGKKNRVEAMKFAFKEGLKEAAEEGPLEMTAQNLIGAAANSLTDGRSNFDTEFSLNEYMEGMALGFIGGSGFSIPSAVKRARVNNEALHEVINNEKDFGEIVDGYVGRDVIIDGEQTVLNQEKADEFKQEISEIKSRAESIFEEKDLTKDQQVQVTALVTDKVRLEKSVSEKADDTIQTRNKAKIKEIDDQLNIILDTPAGDPYYEVDGITIEQKDFQEMMKDPEFIQRVKDQDVDFRINNDEKSAQLMVDIMNGEKDIKIEEEEVEKKPEDVTVSAVEEIPVTKPVEPKPKPDDKKDVKGIPSKKQVGEKPEQARAVERPSKEETRPSGVLQEQKEVVPKKSVPKIPKTKEAKKDPTPEKKLTGVKKATVSDEAIETAEEKIERMSFEEISKLGKQLVDTKKMDVETLSKEVIDAPRSLSAQETAAFIYEKAKTVNEIDALYDDITTLEKKGDSKGLVSAQARLNQLQQKVLDIETAATIAGKQQSAAFAMRRFVEDAEYNLVTQIKQYKNANDGKIPKEVQEKFERLDKELKEADRKIRKYEKELAKKELEAIKVRVAAEPKVTTEPTPEKEPTKEEKADVVEKTKKSAKKEAKRIADAIRKGKISRPGMFMAATPASLVWDSALEATALTVIGVGEFTGTIADGITAGISLIRESAWYKSLTKSEQKESEKQFTRYVTDIYRTTIDESDNRLKIPFKVVKETVAKSGVNDINDLVVEIKKLDEYKDYSDRVVRDAVTRYGTTSKMSKDEINVNIRKMKRVGKLISAIEDVIQKKKRPLRSGLQRDPESDEERRLRMELKELMKDLPLTDQESDQAWKSALDGIKSRLKNQISDLEERIETGKKKEPPKGIVYDAEANSLKKQRDELLEIVKKIEGAPKISDEQRTKYAISAVERQIIVLKTRIEDKNFDPPVKPLPPKETQELREIRKERDKLRKEYNDLKLQERPPKTPEEKLIDRTLSSLNRKEIELQGRIDRKEVLNEKNQRKVMETDEIKAARKRVADLQDELKEMQKEAGVPEMIRLKSFKTRSVNRIKDLQQRIKDKDFEPKAKPQELKYDKEALDLMAEKRKIQAQYDYEYEKAKQANKSITDKTMDFLLEIVSFAKTLRTILDMSAPMRQGLVFMFANPKLAPKAFKEMFRQVFSEKNVQNWHNELLADPNYDLMLQSKLYISDPTNPKMLAREEAFMSNWAAKWHLTKWAVKPSERSYVGFLNQLRVSAFMNGANAFKEMGIDPNTKEGLKTYQAWADYVNNATGRGTLGAFENSAKKLSIIFFSPRLIASRFNLLLNAPKYLNMPEPARKMALKTTLTFIGVGSTAIALAYLALGGQGDDDDKNHVEIDPRSSDFGKIRLGNTRIDIWGGFQQWVRMFSQIISNQRKTSKGKIINLGERYGGDDRVDVFINFFMGKLSPTPAEVVKLAQAKEKKGRLYTKYNEEITWGSFVESQVVPLYIADINELVEEHGPVGGSLLGSLAFFGVGVQNYGGGKKKK